MNHQVNTDEYQGPDRRQTVQGWHVDKTVSISHIITTAVMIVSVVLYLADQDKRIDGNTKDIEHNSSAIQQQESRINRNLDSIDKKLDKLTDIILQRDR